MTGVQDKPVVLCRCCGVAMDAAYQVPLIAGRAGFWYLTCWQAGCKLEAQTFTSKTYHEVDLKDYLKGKS